MAVLSAALNGYANAQHAAVAWAGWGMGLTIPAIILLPSATPQAERKDPNEF
jgi:hypothetical protein